MPRPLCEVVLRVEVPSAMGVVQPYQRAPPLGQGDWDGGHE